MSILGSIVRDLLRKIVLKDKASLSKNNIESSANQNAGNHNNLGMEYFNSGKVKKAVAEFSRAIELNPFLAEAHCNLGIALHKSGRIDAAEACMRKCLGLSPNMANGWGNYGLLLKDLERYDEARNALAKAIKLDPESVGPYLNLGAVLREQGKTDEALQVIGQALSIAPETPQVHYSMADTLQDSGRYRDAKEHYLTALQLKPELPGGWGSLSLLYLRDGNFEKGWELYEYRKQNQTHSNGNFSLDEWDGASLKGKRILIYAEQGLGDEIMFASCFRDVIALSDSCVIQCEKRLVSLFSRSFPDATIVEKGRDGDKKIVDQIDTIDVKVAAGSIPRFLRNSWEDFPRHNSYLHADPVAVGRWRTKLDSLGSGLKVGISWRGGMGATRRRFRSINLEQWMPIFKLEKIHFVSLQYTGCSRELSELEKNYGIAIHHWQNAISDYDETAALVSTLDVVVSVCTSVVHLAGALGTPVLVMVPAVPEWRYLNEGEKMPWYPSIKLVRQTEIDNWTPVISSIVCKLNEFALVESRHGKEGGTC